MDEETETEMKSLTPPKWLSAGAPLPELQVQDRVTAEERQETVETDHLKEKWMEEIACITSDVQIHSPEL